MNRLAPQLAEAVATLPQGENLIMEPKYDGIRLLAQVTENGEIKLWTRNWNNKADQCPEICQELSMLPPNTWLDGEAVGENWGKAQSALTNKAPTERLWYVAFDLLMLNGNDARPLSFLTRRQFLEALFENLPKERVLLTPQAPSTPANHDLIVDLGYEGIVVKALDAPYASGRRGCGWSKIKAEATMDAVITGYKPGKGSISGLIGALRFSQYRVDKLVERGAVGGGFNLPQRRWFSEHIDELIQAQAVIEITHNGIMHTGAPRNPRFNRLRDDKDARECLWDD